MKKDDVQERYDRSYAEGRRDAQDPQNGKPDIPNIALAIVTGGVGLAFADPIHRSYDPPKGDTLAKEAYVQGWKDSGGKK